MKIVLIAHDRNLGLVIFTDYLLAKLGKGNCAVFGTNYLIEDIGPTLEKVNGASKEKGFVILKYIIPKARFSNDTLKFPEELKDVGDFVFRLPQYKEEKMNPVPLEIIKGDDEKIMNLIQEYYKHK